MVSWSKEMVNGLTQLQVKLWKTLASLKGSAPGRLYNVSREYSQKMLGAVAIIVQVEGHALCNG